MARPHIPLNMLLKSLVVVSAPSLAVLVWLALVGTIEVSDLLQAYILICAGLLVLLYPILGNIVSLTRYVNDLARDKKVRSPSLASLNAMTDLSEGLTALHHSWERKRQQMEAVITERSILVDTLPDILIMTDTSLRIVSTNRAARAVFGQNLAGRLLKDVVASDVLVNGAHAVLEDVKGRVIEFRLMDPEPADYRAILEHFPVASSGGISLVITLNDVTELKRVEKMRADFVANASHEIRTPLASIAGFIETLQGPAKDDEHAREQFLAVMHEQAKRMTSLVSDLLSLSKIEMNAHSVPLGRVDMLRIARAEKENFSWMAKQKSMEIILTHGEDIPEVRGDENELRQVVHNLMGNAIKYGHEGTEIHVGLRMTAALPNDPNFVQLQRAIVISVRDHGEGISREHLPRLTERFYRVDSARTRKIGGTGLGLAIVKHILNRHRAVLTIDSQVGEGSTFSVFLPIYEDVL